MKVSIVAIFYNSEQYVKKCLDSILNQTFKEIEIIAVNDCSVDDTLNILLNYKSKYTNITVVSHNKNLGIACARNSGLSKVSGDCFYLIDGDDYLASENAIERLVTKFDAETDWVQGGYLKVNSKDEAIGKIEFTNQDYSSKNEIDACFSNLDFIYTHNKLINRKYANNGFMANVYHEDRIWLASIYNGLKKISAIDVPTYCYVIHDGQTSGKSRMTRQYTESSLVLLRIMVQLSDCWKATIDIFHIVHIEKALYLWESDSLYRREMLKKCNELNTISIDVASFPRATKLIHKMIVAKIPDAIINVIAKSYVKVCNLLKRPL